MGRNEIVEQLFTSQEFNDCINKMEPDHLRDDLRAEVALILLEQGDRVEKIYQDGGFDGVKYYTVRIIRNLIQSNTSLFYKLYRQQAIEITDKFIAGEDQDFEARAAKEEMEDKAIKEIDNLYWYNGAMVKLYLKHGNYRAIERDTRIPYSSAYKTIQKSFEEIKQKVLG